MEKKRTWYKTSDMIPPCDQDLVIFKDGRAVEVKLEAVDIYDGRGGLNPNLSKWWRRIGGDNSDNPPVLEDNCGIDTYAAVVSENVKPKRGE